MIKSQAISNLKSPISRRKAASGFTMIELLISVTVIAVASTVVFGAYRQVTAGQNANIEAEASLAMLADLRGHFQPQGTTDNVSPQVVVNASLAPSNMIQGDDIISSWGTVYNIQEFSSPNSSSNDSFHFTIPNVESDSCARFVSRAEGAFYRVDVGGTTVKDRSAGNNNVDAAELATQCADGADIDLYATLRG